MTARIGDPHVDVCRTCLILMSNVQPPDISMLDKVLIKAFRSILYKSYIKQYLNITGRSMQQVQQWMLPVAAARMAEGIESESRFLHDIVYNSLSLLRYK